MQYGVFFFSCGGLLLTLYLFQNKIVYVPSVPSDARTLFLDPKEFDLHNWKEVFVPTIDGEQIQCWFFKTERNSYSSPTIMFFHGNAGNLSHRLPNIKLMVEKLSCNVFIVSYRGYGQSTGSPSEIGLKLDSTAALLYLQTCKEINPRKIIVFGRSLGGAVAIDLAGHTTLTPTSPPLAAIILENTFTSIYDMQKIMFPALNYFSFLCTNRWMSVETINRVTVPVLMISGGSDEVVPSWMMEKLYESCKSKKKFILFPLGEHMDTWTKQNYFEQMKDFIDQLFLAG